jgi:hypothetical protein
MAAEKLGEKTIAKANYEKLITLAGGATTGGPQLAGAASERPEITAARKFIAAN